MNPASDTPLLSNSADASAPLFIVGYMASGKTTFGRALARRTGREFIDLDFYIEQRFRLPVRKIFEKYGEERFREIERNMLREAGEFEGTVIACGGGTPCFFDNMDYMLERGQVVWLDSSPGRIVDRLILNRSRRPLLADKKDDEIADEVSRGLDLRCPHYSRAHIRFSGDLLETRSQIDSTISRFLATSRTIPD